ncbi:hypothetical protein [Corallococcus exiguus]|uniref:Uncharacterized protein n=1 Tax=Corallococcus exiguus TaxID=83462 RepID=A0A7X4Y718_9BACT|nr:hypothetical protein [Corallococcus exiguus]NBC39349.1 hypothetical protein [Corallococcus exiguus]TNV66866.1 hypothetical protein FH620_04100 [Corallococcus exiguus]
MEAALYIGPNIATDLHRHQDPGVPDPHPPLAFAELLDVEPVVDNQFVKHPERNVLSRVFSPIKTRHS